MSKKLRTFALRNNSNLDSIEYQVMKSKTNKKNIMKKDEFVDLMRQQGWTAEEVKEMVDVPLCGCVRAGVPDEYGDNPHETGSIPMEYVSGKCWLVVVQGDSMRDYDLHEGDRLLVRTQDVARSGEIVVAHYDGGPTVKTYFEDEDGSKWLTPGKRQIPGHAHRRDARVSHLWRGADDHPRAPAGRPCDLYQGGEEGQAERANAGLGAGHRLRTEPDPRAYPV